MKKITPALPLVAALALGACLAIGCGSPPPKVVVAAPPPPPPPPPPPAPALPVVGAQLDIKGEVEFDIAKSTIRDTPASQDVLGQVLKILTENAPITRLRVEGHTDSDGRPQDNQTLSEQRAAAVVKWLVDHGVAAGRLSGTGCAARDPLVPNDTAEHKQKNRRIEFDIEELGGKRPDGYTEACAPNTARHT